MDKISSMLDAVADSLEARGLIKEAYEIDKVADAIEAAAIAPVGNYYVVTYVAATGKKGVVGLYAANPADATKRVEHMISADVGGKVTSVKPGREQELEIQ